MCKLNNAQKVNLYVQLRDRRAQRKKAFEEADASDKAAQEKLEAIFLSMFNQEGIDSISTEFGTAYKSTRISATVADWDEVLKFIKEKEFWSMLEKRVSKAAVDEYIGLNEVPPPGVNVITAQTVNVRRS